MWKHQNLHILLVSMKSGAAVLENSLAVPQKVKRSYHTTKIVTPRYTPKRTENICLYRNLYRDIHSSIIHNSQKVEITKVSMN